METVLQLILALIGLGFLVFIHELGHYWVARRVGMTVEVFSIGFGKPVYSWMRSGVKWQVGWLPFGGYVKIAGMELSSNDKDPSKKDPYQISDGFYGRKPFQRILVALAGPLANFILAFLIFGIIWLTGGREKPFAEFTQRAGWVDSKSQLYAKGFRPGDIISEYNGYQLNGIKDLFYAGLTANGPIDLKGYTINSSTGQQVPFEYKIKPYQYPGSPEGLLTVGILSPASYLIYARPPGSAENNLPDGSTMKNSGIQYGDQVVWANGERVFSLEQLSSLINEPRALMTIQRGPETLLARVPRIKIDELKLDAMARGELLDWEHESGLKSKLNQLYFIPYNLNSEAVVENRLNFIDQEVSSKVFGNMPSANAIDLPLQEGDKIIAIDGYPITHSSQLFKELQEQHVQLIVSRDHSLADQNASWKQADQDFDNSANFSRIQQIASSIGTSHPIEQSGNLFLLKPVVPKTKLQAALNPEQKAWLNTEILEQRKKIEGISDPEKRDRVLRALEDSQKRLVLGITLQDKKVNYNPSPVVLFENVFVETWRTLLALFSGYLNPKWLSGPVGIVQVIQHGWSIGSKEALFWIAAISVNLGFLNLLPIPFLDGGHILFSLAEMVSGKRIKPKVLERLILPFVIIIIGFLIFVTYYDITRLF